MYEYTRSAVTNVSLNGLRIIHTEEYQDFDSIGHENILQAL
jgi:hypothetical protein